MSQTSYTQDPAVAFAGMPADGHLLDADSGFAAEKLDFGYAGMRSDDTTKPRSVRKQKRNASTLVAAGDLITANVVNGNVNGVALSPITFASTHLATITAVADAIVAALLVQGIVATYALTGSNRTVTFTAIDGTVDLTSFIVTAGSTQTTFTMTNVGSDALADFVGVIRYDARAPRISDGLPGFEAKDSVALVRKGRIFVPVTHDTTDNADAYIDVTAGSESKFTTVSTGGNIGPVGKFRGIWTTAGLGLAVLELNLP
jgi:hypothetical protein